MTDRLGNALMALGAALLAAALALFGWNLRQADAAARAAERMMPALMQQIQQAGETPVAVPPGEALPALQVDGHDCIGCLSIPALGLELPVLADWDDRLLKIAPCRYYGTAQGEDLVIMAHNYERHFGRLDELAEGAEVLFADAQGNVTRYEVTARNLLPAAAVEEMTAGEYDLTLFTCNYSGRARVTVYCDRAENG